MDSTIEKRLRNILACVLRVAKQREAIVRIICHTTGFLKNNLMGQSARELEEKIILLLKMCSVETICAIDEYGFFKNNFALSKIFFKVLELQNLLEDKRFNDFKARYRKY